jgi:hypothetical protein
MSTNVCTALGILQNTSDSALEIGMQIDLKCRIGTASSYLCLLLLHFGLAENNLSRLGPTRYPIEVLPGRLIGGIKPKSRSIMLEGLIEISLELQDDPHEIERFRSGVIEVDGPAQVFDCGIEVKRLNALPCKLYCLDVVGFFPFTCLLGVHDS